VKWLVVTFVGLAVLAAVVTHFAFSDAAFTSGSTTGVRASTAPLSSNTVRVSAGDAQSAPAGAQVATPPAVLVTDTGGNPVAGVEVSFAVTGGGGSVSGAPVTTDATGVAAVESWRLGTAAGENELTATAAGLASADVTFTATGLAAPAAGYVVAVSDERPVAGAAVSVTAQLVDELGNAVATPGVRVTWSKTGSGGSLTWTSRTDAAGMATATLTTSTVAGRTHTVKATSSNPARTGVSPAIVTVAGPPAKLTVSAGNQQSAPAGTTVAVAPRVLVRDANNNPVPGAEVTFAVAAGNGRVDGSPAYTDQAGLATAGAWTLGTTAGGNTLSATVAGLPGTAVKFTAVGSAGPATGYVVTASTSTPKPGASVILRAQLADRYGNPVKTYGVAVAWSLDGPDGVLTTASFTNSNGIATAYLLTGRTPGATYTVTASSTAPEAWTGSTPPIVVTP
jgi:adhesin/invasin